MEYTLINKFLIPFYKYFDPFDQFLVQNFDWLNVKLHSLNEQLDDKLNM